MATFTDRGGKTWELRITYGLLDRLKAVGLDLDSLSSEKGNPLAILIMDRRVLGSVLWILVEKQVLARTDSTTPEDFFADFDGPTLEAAGTALLDAVLDFFPSRVTAPIKKGLPKILAKMDEAAEAEINRRLSVSLDGDSPERSESTPAS